MTFLYHKHKDWDIVMKKMLYPYGIDIKSVEDEFSDNSFLILPHGLDISEFSEVFKKYKDYNIIFILDFTMESFTDFEMLESFYYSAELNDIDYDRMVVCYNNLNHIGYIKYFYKNRTVNTVSLPSFYLSLAVDDIKPLNRFDYSEFDYTCFNFWGRNHKKKTIKYIDSLNLNCYSTYAHGLDFKLKNNIIFKPDDAHLNPDHNPELDISIYYNGKVNICTESIYYENYEGFDKELTITEKVFRNILLKIPFTVVGSRYTMSRLSTLGFKTFDSVIDESYDYAHDGIRYIKSVEAATELKKKWNTSEVEDILEYNQDRFLNIQNGKNFIEEYFIQSLEYFYKKNTTNLI